tara:strand:+ start:2960 stop:3274 length:315 start_codon:yes stop_codon:yes gene_type:complete
MRYIIYLALVLFSLNIIADDKVRPGPHNKIGHTKVSPESKKETFFYRLFNDEIDFGSNETNERNVHSNDRILSQIEKLADLKDRGIISQDEFNSKKTLLLDKIQ